MNDSTERPEAEDLQAEPPLTGSTRSDDARPVEQIPTAASRPPVRMSTVVWGLIIIVVGAGVLARALGAEFDNELALIALLCVAGVALVATSIVSATRKR
ncbi:hypothetical protein SAMN05216410_1650 [Sanguibacter gelidistatuariae]|uniref:Uncharacterized protein n=1 Tax=Sanguibacter gelidistatuariae TaxID=1814289 RepID=A0A1G6KPH6_9MICO|nr:hypothetical protein [Sanguibacter gelidistatuariae]SDC32950.1 hypothetical protein SAMN05216410_1650 [Sanguibacter gelidistatuariae]